MSLLKALAVLIGALALEATIGRVWPQFHRYIDLMLLPVIWFGWAPRLSYVPIWEDPSANLQQFMFPALAMGISLSAIVRRSAPRRFSAS